MKKLIILAVVLLSSVVVSPSFSNSNGPDASVSSNGMIDYSTLAINRILFEGCPGFQVQDYAAKGNMYMGHFEVAWKVPQIHAVNPSMICLLYRNIRAVYQRTTDEYQMFLNNSWILKDANGTLIHDTDYPGSWIVDPGNAAYQTWVANWLKGYLDQYGYNGVFLDNLLPSTEYMYDTSPSSPINPRTGKVFRDQEFEQAVIQLVNTVKSTIGNRLVIGNGIFNGERFFQSSRNSYYTSLLLQSNIDGIESEDWLMSIFAAQWYPEATWQASINFTVWLENNFFAQRPGRMFLPVCQNAGPYDISNQVLPTNCTAEQYTLYCFSSLLLAVNSNRSDYLNFGYYVSNYTESLFSIPLGVQSGAYYIIGGTHVYARDFSRVKVLVNPTGNPYVVSLDGSYETLDGQLASSPITVEPHTGMILRKA